MMDPRTSITHPLQIAEVQVPGAEGLIGITFCPGKKQEFAMSGAWDRDLGRDLDVIRSWGASTVITLVEREEIEALKVADLESEVAARGMRWLHMPITDMSAPDSRFAEAWSRHGAGLIRDLRSGVRILAHCKGGLGRAGTVAALILVESGMASPDAIDAVRAARTGAIETREQERFLLNWPNTSAS